MSDQYERLARQRRANYASTRPWHDQREELGIISEKTLCGRYGIEPDLRNKPGGDGGRDVELELQTARGPQWFKVDAKGRNDYAELWMIVNCRQVKPQTIYVLVRVTSFERWEGECVGWLWGAEIAERGEIADFGRGEDALCYRVDAGELRDMAEIDRRFLRGRHAD